MTEPLTDSRRTSANPTTARTPEPLDAADSVQYPDTGHAPTHMPGSGGVEHGMPAP